MKLEKIEFGGIHGQCHCDMVLCLFMEFQELSSKISNSSYDALDLQNKVVFKVLLINNAIMCVCFFQRIVSDLNCFKEKIEEFDRRLASIINKAFEDASNCEAAFKVIKVLQ